MKEKPNFKDYYLGQLVMFIKNSGITIEKSTGDKYKEVNHERHMRILFIVYIVIGLAPLIIIGVQNNYWIYSLVLLVIYYFLMPLRYFLIKFEKVEDEDL
jgi:hypothetical protein